MNLNHALEPKNCRSLSEAFGARPIKDVRFDHISDQLLSDPVPGGHGLLDLLKDYPEDQRLVSLVTVAHERLGSLALHDEAAAEIYADLPAQLPDTHP